MVEKTEDAKETRMGNVITIKFEVEIDTPSEVQRRAKQIVVDALRLHGENADLTDSDRALLAEMLREK